MKGVMSVDPRLMALVGRKLYKGDPLVITARELFQNSLDACRRAGTNPDIRISTEIGHESTGYWVTLVCEDNGDGMSPDEIVTKFLCLGAEKKTSSEQVGGFGIAKAAIMSHRLWSVRTNTSYLSSQMQARGEDIQEDMEDIHGTRISVLAGPYTYESWANQHIREASLLIALSNYSSTINGVEVTPPIGTVTAELTAGLSAIMLNRYSDELLGDVEGITIVRLKGLPQFLISQYNERKTNIIFDIETSAKPADDDYPFDMSRERVTDTEMSQKIDNLVSYHDTNSHTSMNMVEDAKREKVASSIVRGNLLRGHGQMEPERQATPTGSGNWAMAGLVERTTDAGVKILDGTGVYTVLWEYLGRSKAEFRRDIRILELWQKVLECSNPVNEEYGIGLAPRMSFTAVRKCDSQTGDVMCYVINPELVPDMPERSMALWMWHIVCHEVSHAMVQSHNEQFTSTEVMIAEQSAQRFDTFLRRL